MKTMAEAGSIEVAITATTDALSEGLAAALSLLQGAVPSFSTAALAVGGAITAGLGASIYAYANLEEAAAGLAVALRNQGDASQATLQDMLDYAQSLQEASRFSSTEIIQAETMLAQMGMQGTVLKQATQATLDLGTQTGNLTAAARLIGSAYEGAGTGLRRFGIVIEQGLPPSLVFQETMNKIQEQFGGRAQADVNSFAGQITQLLRVIEDLGKSLGQSLAPTIVAVMEFLQDNKTQIIDDVFAITNAVIDLINTLIRLGQFFAEKIDLIERVVKGVTAAAGASVTLAANAFKVGAALGAAGAGALGIGNGAEPGGAPVAGSGPFQFPHLAPQAGPSTEGLAASAQGAAGAGGAATANPTTFAALWQAAYDKVFGIQRDGSGKILSDIKTTIAQIEHFMTGMTSALGSGINSFLDGIIHKGQNLGQALMSIGTSMEAFVLKTLSDIAAEWLVKHVVMAAANAAFNATVTANTVAADATQIATKKATSMAMIPGIIGLTNAELVAAYAPIPFVGPALSAAAIGAADAQISGYAGMIAAMASGGIVDRPTLAMIGEGQGPEAVIPLNSPQARNLMGRGDDGGGGGNEIHLHISGQFVEGSADKWEKLTRNVIVPALERHSRKARATRGKIW